MPGTDVHVAAPISVGQAILGGSVIIPTLDGDIKLKVALFGGWLVKHGLSARARVGVARYAT